MKELATIYSRSLCKDLTKFEIKEALKMAKREIKEWEKFIKLCEKQLK